MFHYQNQTPKSTYGWHLINLITFIITYICQKNKQNLLIIKFNSVSLRDESFNNEYSDYNTGSMIVFDDYYDSNYNESNVYHPFRLYLIFLAIYLAFQTIIIFLYFSFKFVRRIFRNYQILWSLHKMLMSYLVIFETDCIYYFIGNIVQNDHFIENYEKEWLILKILIINVCRWFLLLISTVCTFSFLNRLIQQGRYRPKFGWFSQNFFDYIIVRYLIYCYYYNHMSNWSLHWSFTLLISSFYLFDIRQSITIFNWIF